MLLGTKCCKVAVFQPLQVQKLGTSQYAQNAERPLAICNTMAFEDMWQIVLQLESRRWGKGGGKEAGSPSWTSLGSASSFQRRLHLDIRSLGVGSEDDLQQWLAKTEQRCSEGGAEPQDLTSAVVGEQFLWNAASVWKIVGKQPMTRSTAGALSSNRLGEFLVCGRVRRSACAVVSRQVEQMCHV